MKKILLAALTVAAFIFTSVAQGKGFKEVSISISNSKDTGNTKTDKMTFINGDTKEGKVIAVENDKIEFIHDGEILRYKFARQEIEKIEYASGRTEVMTAKKTSVGKPVASVARNTVAILPLLYTGDESAARIGDMRYYLQEIAITDYSKEAAELEFKDGAEINAILLQQGIDPDNTRKYTPKELAALLQVEYVVMGSVLQDKTGLHTVTNNSGRETVERDYQAAGGKVKYEAIRSTNTNQHYETDVFISIYNEGGEKIYSNSRHSILSDKDAYKNALHYLLKRTPLYKR